MFKWLPRIIEFIWAAVAIAFVLEEKYLEALLTFMVVFILLFGHRMPTGR